MFFDGVWGDLALVAIIAVAAYVLVLWVASVVWTYRDVSSRTSDAFTQTIALFLVLVFSIPGLLVYLVLRPKDTLMDAYDRQLEAEALLHEIQEQATCPRCRRKIDDAFIACPYCRTALRSPCENCAKPMSSSWVLCPYCSAERPRAAAPAAPVTAEVEPPARPKRASTAKYTPPATTAASSPGPADAAPETRL